MLLIYLQSQKSKAEVLNLCVAWILKLTSRLMGGRYHTLQTMAQLLIMWRR